MTRNWLYILLIGMFAIGVSAVMTPLVGTANAITAEEMLADPVLENRARNLSRKLRCLVCQNQSIDDSDADLAKDLRREVRTQLVQGKTDKAILADLRAKYGDFVLLAPPMAKNTLALWLAPIGFMLLGIGITLGMRQRASGAAAPAISAADRAQIEALKQHRKTTNEDGQP
tara:strand:- start:8 stop:523 length:516 start_codon:yes stop_codon:yes gene_type:complete